MKNRYTVIIKPPSTEPREQSDNSLKSAQPPRYDRERDEPAFERAWAKVKELKEQGKLAPVPPHEPFVLRKRSMMTQIECDNLTKELVDCYNAMIESMKVHASAKDDAWAETLLNQREAAKRLERIQNRITMLLAQQRVKLAPVDEYMQIHFPTHIFTGLRQGSPLL